ncbi:uncharacterized protein DNG_00982 [Cephalotrichum gorgonifer]|uniref:Uncharacterized protein n=1 Tax=Cephalotrichum gorgonifer TaxID=2041049 RepID=A0AAE8SRT6_9PEZI|nr:uncharacterized protein DNG_00982 [Cephalotrichum gorgonifer]
MPCKDEDELSDQNKSKKSVIDERKANLPIPEQPPGASDWQSMDARNVNAGPGRVESHAGTDPHSIPDDLSKVGREGKDNLSGPPKDAAY